MIKFTIIACDIVVAHVSWPVLPSEGDVIRLRAPADQEVSRNGIASIRTLHMKVLHVEHVMHRTDLDEWCGHHGMHEEIVVTVEMDQYVHPPVRPV